MTTSDVFAAVRRRWYAVLLGLVVTALAVLLVHGRPGVYEGQRSVRFVAPAGTDNNGLAHSSTSLISMAGLVERMVNDTRGLPPTASVDVTLPDRGIHDGSAVVLPNDGGQWNYQFNRPELLVQAAGSSPEQVTRLMDRATRVIQKTLTDFQSAVPRSQRIEARVVVPTSAVTYAGGRPKPALGATALLGIGLSGSAAVVLDRLLVRRRRRSRRRARRAPARATPSVT